MEFNKSTKKKAGRVRRNLYRTLAFALIFSLVLQGGIPSAYAATDAPVIEVTDGTELDAAIKSATSLTVISLQNDIDAIASATYDNNRIIIEGNGHTISGAGVSGNTALRFARSNNNSITLKNLVMSNLTSNLRYGGGAIGVYHGTLIIENCAFVNNASTAALSASLTNGGGAVLSHYAANVFTVTNSTFVGNSTNMSGGAISSRGPATINNSTIYGNIGGIYGGGIAAGSATLITLRNSIVVGNEVLGGTVSSVDYPGGYGDVKNLTDGGHNLLGVVEPVSATDPTPSVAVDVTTGTGKTRAGLFLASSPANNGSSGAARGAGLTLAITNPSSAAIGGADPDTAAYLDQRGFLRDSAPDIGAYEYGSDGIVSVLALLRTLLDDTSATYTDAELAKYTPAGRAALAAALANVQAVLDLDTSALVQDAYDAAWGLSAAVSQMADFLNAQPYADIFAAALAGGQYNVDGDDYTPASYLALTTAVQGLNDIISAPQDYTVTEAEDAYVALVGAALGLVYTADLTDMITYARAEIETGKYIPVSVDYVTGFAEAAEALITRGDATQAEIQAATTNLLTALQEYFFEKGDKSALATLVGILSVQNTSLYTPASVAALTDALATANVTLADDDALSGDVDEAYEALLEAVGGLVLQSNKSALGSAITKANQVLADTGRYLASSLVDLQSVLPGAVTVYEDANAAQSAVNAQAAALNAALAKVRVIANKSKLQELYNLLAPTDPLSYTPASFHTLSAALGNALLVLGRSDEEVAQNEVDNAVNALQAAFEGLIRNPAEASENTGTSNNGPASNPNPGTNVVNPVAAPIVVAAGSPGSVDATSPAVDTELSAPAVNPATTSSSASDPAPGASNLSPGIQLDDSSVPLAGIAERAGNGTSPGWLPLALGAIALALFAAFLVVLTKLRRERAERAE